VTARLFFHDGSERTFWRLLGCNKQEDDLVAIRSFFRDSCDRTIWWSPNCFYVMVSI